MTVLTCSTSHRSRFALAMTALWLVLGSAGALAICLYEAPQMMDEYTG